MDFDIPKKKKQILVMLVESCTYKRSSRVSENALQFKEKNKNVFKMAKNGKIKALHL